MTRARELGKLANTNTLTADNTNNFVGIASTQPTTRLDVVGVVSATSFSGDGSSLTGIAATDNVSTNGLVVLGISTLAGATFSGVSTFSNNVILEANLDLQDNDKILLGTGDDLEIYHSGSHSFITDSGTGNLYINSNNVVITNAADNETLASFIENGAVELYYDNDLHFATTADGCKTNGDLSFRGDGDVEQILFDASDASLKFTDSKKAKFGTGDDLEIYHDGTNSWVKDVGTNALVLDTDGPRVTITKNGATETMANFNTDGSVDLYYDNSKKLETTSDGVTVTGTIDGQTELRTWLFG